jgi:hypothetical protein
VVNGLAGQLLELTYSKIWFIDAQPSLSLLVYFSGVLGFSPEPRTFYPPKDILCASPG